MSKTNVTLEQKSFEQVGKVSESIGHRGAPLIDRVFGRWLGTPADRDWVVDAEWGRIQQEPVHARRLLYIMVLALIALLIWAAHAPLDEVARGDGRVIPSRQLQVLQSMDGGIVEEILVREGQIVEQGDLLLRIDPTRAVSSLQESRAQFASLTAEVARLQALIGDLEEPDFPVDLILEAPDIVSHERHTFFNNRDELQEQIAIYERQLEQRQQDLREARAARSQHASTVSLVTRELQVTRPLLQSGAVSDVDIIRLERDLASARGELNRADASISRSEAAIEEAKNRIREVELTVRNRWNAQLSESRSRLNALAQAESGLEDIVRQTEIRAPVRGTVQRLFTNTLGGVVTPGREVLEIVPLDDQLIIEARIAPQDIAFIRPGQSAMIKFTAYDFAIFGGLEAEVEHISADTITDDRDNTFFLVRLRTHESGFDEDLTIIPGMTTQVDIMTGKKTVLEYLLKPVLRATSQAMSER